MSNEISFENLGKLDALLSQANLEKVTADGAGFKELEDGFYLTTVEKLELRETSKGDPMVTGVFKTVGDGYKFTQDELYNESIEVIPTTSQRVWINWVLKDTSGIERYVSDMLKFEADIVNHTPLLLKECFISSAAMGDAFACLEGQYIFIMVQTGTDKEGKPTKRYNLVKWAKAIDSGLVTEETAKELGLL